MTLAIGSEVILVNSPFRDSPNIGRRVLVVGYSNHQPECERWFQIVGIGTALVASGGLPVNAPASHLSEDAEPGKPWYPDAEL